MSIFKSKKKQEEFDEEDEENQDIEEIAEERARISNQPKRIKQEEPAPLSKQEVGELINANIIRLHELFNYYRQLKE